MHPKAADDRFPRRRSAAGNPGHPVDSDDLIIVAYIWRAETRDVVWGLERWPSPERRLVLYRLDPGFEPLPARQLHAELQHAGAAALADQTRAVLAA